MDCHFLPVYKDENGKLWKDADPRSHAPAALYSVQGDEFDGAPILPRLGSEFRPVMKPKRKTW